MSNFDEFKCPNCGYYLVNRQLIEEMTVARQIFHAACTQQFLLTHSWSGQLPAITRIETTKHRLIVESTRKGLEAVMLPPDAVPGAAIAAPLRRPAAGM